MTGTLSSGIDTSDANATSNDIIQDKSAYVDGVKINGNLVLEISDVSYQGLTLTDFNSEYLMVSASLGGNSRIAFDANVKANYMIVKEYLAQFIGLTADKIKAGETILGITGTYTGEDNDVSL